MTETTLNSTLTDTPSSQKADPLDGRPFKCEEFWADGTKCLEDFKRKGDLTKHRNAYHIQSAHFRAQNNTGAKPATESKSVAGDFPKPDVVGKVRKNTIKTKTAAVTKKGGTGTKRKTGSRAKRSTGKPVHPEVPAQVQTTIDAELPAEVESFPGANASASNLYNSENHIAMNTQASHEETSKPGVQSHRATDGSQVTVQTANLTASYANQPSFNQQEVDPYGQQVAHAYVSPDFFNEHFDPNEASHSTTSLGYPPSWPQDDQQWHPYGAQDVAEEQNYFPPLDAFGAGDSEFVTHSYPHSEPPTILPPHEPFGSGGLEVTGYGYPQYQASMLQEQEQQQDNPEDDDGLGELSYGYPQEWAQMLQQDPFEEDGAEIAGHGFLPEQEHFEDGCFGIEWEYCSACRARFLEWFPTSEFRQFVEACVSESVEDNPPM